VEQIRRKQHGFNVNILMNRNTSEKKMCQFYSKKQDHFLLGHPNLGDSCVAASIVARITESYYSVVNIKPPEGYL
jgi:hypothetical protein